MGRRREDVDRPQEDGAVPRLLRERQGLRHQVTADSPPPDRRVEKKPSKLGLPGGMGHDGHGSGEFPVPFHDPEPLPLPRVFREVGKGAGHVDLDGVVEAAFP